MKTDKVDSKRIDSIISDYENWDQRVKFQRKQIDFAQSELNKLNAEIVSLVGKINDADVGINNIPIEEMQEFFEDKNKMKTRLNTLHEYETQLTKRIKRMENALSTEQSYLTKKDFMNDCWSVVYEGLLPTFEKSELRKLITIGVKAKKSIKSVMDDLSIEDNLDLTWLEGIAKQFKIPV